MRKNTKRAKRAIVALNAYLPQWLNPSGFNKLPAQEKRDAIVDLLTDLRHLAHARGIDFYSALDSSYTHYAAELRGQE